MSRQRNPDPQVAAMERARDRQTARARALRPKIVAAVLALRSDKKGKV